MTAAAVLRALLEQARKEVSSDAEHWECQPAVRTRREAEEFGRLIGYAEGLEAALKLLESQS